MTESSVAMAADQPDFESVRLAVRLEQEEIQVALEHLTQNESSGDVLVGRLAALGLHLEELRTLEDSYAGQRMQQSMYTAMLSDSRAIAEQRLFEQQAIDERIAAAEVVQRPAPQIAQSVLEQLNSGDYDDELLVQLEEISATGERDFVDDTSSIVGASVNGGQDQSIAGSEITSADAPNTPEFTQPNLEQYMDALRLSESEPKSECVVCTELLSRFHVVTLPCGDIWCRTCITRLFEDATKNEGVYPPKCCRAEISVESLSHLLSIDLRARFAAKALEWTTKDRTYCHERTCSTFIPPGSITERRAICPACSRETCSECKAKYHVVPPCPEITPSDELFREIAVARRWPKCPGCHRTVEITHGCNHMTQVNTLSFWELD